MIGGVLTWRYPAGALYINVGGDRVSIVGVDMAVGSIWASVIALGVGAVLLLSSARRPSGVACAP